MYSRKIDVVYPLGKGSRMDDMELMLSVRSLKFCREIPFGDVWVIGEQPRSDIQEECRRLRTDYHHIPAKDNHQKNVNIARKIVSACKNPDISDPFLYMQDDIIFLKKIVWINHYWNGSLESGTPGAGYYKSAFEKTISELKKLNWSRNNYETHRPFVIKKDVFMKALVQTDWESRFGLNIKSVYCNSPYIRNWEGNPGALPGDNIKMTRPPQDDGQKIRKHREKYGMISTGDWVRKPSLSTIVSIVSQ